MPIDKHKAVEAKLAGKTYADIAREQGVSRAAVTKMFNKLKAKQSDVAVFQQARPDVLDALQHKCLAVVANVLESMGKQDLGSLTASQKAEWVRTGVTSAGILYDKGRLERGQSTQNVQGLHLLAVRDALKAGGVGGDDQPGEG